MENPITVLFEPYGRRVKVKIETSIFEAARKAGIRLRSGCGGKGLCGKCKVIVADKKAAAHLTEVERGHLSLEEISAGYRLACLTLLKTDATIMVPEESRVGALKIQAFGEELLPTLDPAVKKYYITLAEPTLFNAKPDMERVVSTLDEEHSLKELKMEYGVLRELPRVLRTANWKVTVAVWNDEKIIAVEEGDTTDKLLGLALDIGTSKIVGCIVDLKDGKTLALSFIENPQILYGEDVISRITFASDNRKKLKILHKQLIDGINEVINHACAHAGVTQQNIYEAVVVGNTAMHHFFLGLPTKNIAVSPFTPVVRKPLNVKPKELGLRIHPEGNVHILPIIAGFVGADALADALSSRIGEFKELSLLLDVGTNTEIFVGNSEDILSCSCASGPAFEGFHVKHGMKAITGAIEKVFINPDSNFDVTYETVGGAAPLGLCGSAMVDVLAELFKCRIINNRGRFNVNLKTPRLRTFDGNAEFVIVWKEESGTGRDITVTQKDINEIQLAKAAVFAGCWVLMKRKNVQLNDLHQVLIAGSFGSYINPENAKITGLVPDVATEKIRFVGNAALSGAKMALISKEERKKSEELSKKIRYLELATDHDFSIEFADAMFIPHKNLERFPTVKNKLKIPKEGI
ncbi:MAG: ASKHA domain-containing protein [Candidatus Bathyarchaeia archaeon]